MLLALLLQLAPGEKLEGLSFWGPKEARFLDEAHAREYLESYEGKGELRRDGEAWVVRVSARVELLYAEPKPPYRFEKGIFYKRTGRFFLTRAEADAFAKEDPRVEGIRPDNIDGMAGFTAVWTEKEDLLAKARETLREEGVCDPWVLRSPPAPWTLERTRYHGSDLTFDTPVNVVASDFYLSEKNVGFGCDARLYTPGPLIERQMLGKLLDGDPSVVRTANGTVVHLDAGGGWHVGWKHREGVFIHLAGFNPYRSDIVAAHLKRFPSMWGADFKLDVRGWAREEGAYRLARMKDRQKDAKAYNHELLRLASWFEVPNPWNTGKARSDEELAEHYKALLDWWDDGKVAPRKKPVSPRELRLLERRD